MCRAKNGELLTKKDQVRSRWKEHFEQHLNAGEERDPSTRAPDLRDYGGDIDLSCREEIESALKYLKNKKAFCRRRFNCGRAAENGWPPVGGCTRRSDLAGLDERDTT
jgi:hypothetical protein